VWHGMRRAFRQVQVLLSDEGTNGLAVHVINESADNLALRLDVSCLRDGEISVVSGSREIELLARMSASFAATDLFGAFFDTTYAFRFGAPSHDVTVARLVDSATGAEIATAFQFPRGRMAAMRPARLAAVLERDAKGWFVNVETHQLAQSVALAFPGYLASDSWFHLASGATRHVRLKALPTANAARPSGTIRQLGGGPVLTL